MQSSTRSVTFQLPDDSGGPHNYSLRLHRATEGRPILLRLAARGAGPLAELLRTASVDSMRAAIRAPTAPVADGSSADPAPQPGGLGFLASMDVEALSGAMERALIGVAGDAGLQRDLLLYVERDRAPLRDEGVFDDAFTGNYGELLRLYGRVIVENGFFPLGSLAPNKAASVLKAI